MKNLLSKALLALAVDKKAREALKHSRENAKKAPAVQTPQPKAAAAAAAPAPAAKAVAPAAAAPAKAPKDLTERLEQADKSDRRALIRNAIKLRQSKMNALDDLSEEQRRELQVAALRAIIERGKRGGNGS